MGKYVRTSHFLPWAHRACREGDLCEARKQRKKIEDRQIDRRTGRSIRINNRNSLLTCSILEESLLSSIVTCTRQTRKIEYHWNLRGYGSGFRWKVEVYCHLAAGCACIVGQFEEFAAKRGDCCSGFEGHFEECYWGQVLSRGNGGRCCL